MVDLWLMFQLLLFCKKCIHQTSKSGDNYLSYDPVLVVGVGWIFLVNHRFTVNSHKSRRLFINYDFRWLMVAEIYWK